MKRFVVILFTIIVLLFPFFVLNGMPIDTNEPVISNVFAVLLFLFLIFVAWLICTIVFFLLSIIVIGISGFVLKRVAPDVHSELDAIFCKDDKRERDRYEIIAFLGMTVPPFAWWCYNIYRIYLLFQ